MASDRGFVTFDHGHHDLVLATDFNFYGTRMVTASSDHRLKVWDKRNDDWVLTDTWRAHDAEIVDVKWNGPYMGEVIGSIGEDGCFRLWEEDPTETPNSGRRWKQIYTQVSETRVPFQSMDIKNINTETYIALISRDGYLTVIEPVDQDDLRGGEWQALTGQFVCATPSPSVEAGFRVAFHREPFPCWTAIMAGLDRKALSLAVAAMDVVKVLRTDRDRRFYLAATLTGARDILRDISWAAGAMRGFDLIATASKDGAIRIYELTTPQHLQESPRDYAQREGEQRGAEPQRAGATAPPSGSNQPSGIGAGLATARPSTEGAAAGGTGDDAHPGRVLHDVKMIAELSGVHGGAAWRVEFDPLGSVLVSTGDDGAVRLWKRALDGEWLEHSEIDVTRDE